jgi:hypothetical protein
MSQFASMAVRAAGGEDTAGSRGRPGHANHAGICMIMGDKRGHDRVHGEGPVMQITRESA